MKTLLDIIAHANDLTSDGFRRGQFSSGAENELFLKSFVFRVEEHLFTSGG